MGITLSRAALENPSILHGHFKATSAWRDKIAFEISEGDLLSVRDRWPLLQPLLQKNTNWVLKHAGLARGTVDLVRRFQPRAVKLAPSLIQGAMHHREQSDFVRTTAHLLHSLDCKVWAEGVADQAIWEWVIRCQLDGGQGHFITDI